MIMKAKESFQALIIIFHTFTNIIILIIIFLLTILIGGAFFKWRKFNLTTAISVSITVNIIYVMYYLVPRILLEFINNPLQAMYNHCMLIVIIVHLFGIV